MNKVFCEECKNYGNFSGRYCTAGYKHNTPTHHDETPFKRAYDERSLFTEKEMLELNKDNYCIYYEKNI